MLWVCENNQYGMGTAVERASALKEIHKKADGYGIPNSRVEGMDVMNVYEAAKEAIAYVRAEGPYFLEVLTYRYEGHSMGDPERYRTKDEVGEWEENDPIGIYRTYLLKESIAKEAKLNKMEEEVLDEVQEAVQFAEESPEPTWEDLINSVYVEEYRDEKWPR